MNRINAFLKQNIYHYLAISGQRKCNRFCEESIQFNSILEASEALSFSRGLAFPPSSATTLPHINSSLTSALTKVTALPSFEI